MLIEIFQEPQEPIYHSMGWISCQVGGGSTELISRYRHFFFLLRSITTL